MKNWNDGLTKETDERIAKSSAKTSKTNLAKSNARDFDEVSFETKRRRIIEQQNYCCAECGLSEWRGQKLPLEIDHKNGISSDDARENLVAVCPNCHSLTITWRGRNKPRYNGEKKVSDDVLIEALKIAPSIRQALLKVGLAAKGGNYERAKRLNGSMVK
jgi:hypothetical protein